MNFTVRVPLSSFHLFASVTLWSGRSLFCPLRSSSFLPLSPSLSSSLIAATASSAFMYFYAFRSISAIVFGGFFASEATRSLDLSPALKVVNCTLSSASSTSKVSRVKRFTYILKVSFSPCLMVSKWSAGLLGHCPPMKWHRKALLNCSKLSTDDVGNLVNHSLTAPLRMVGKERHSISSGGYWRPNVVLKVLRWSWGSLSPSNDSSWGNRNFDGTRHSRTAVVNGESVALTSLSTLRSAFSLIVLLNSSISFLIFRRRSEFWSSGETGLRWSLLRWLFPSSSGLPLDRFSSYWSRSFIPWFCLVSSSTVAASAWTCWARAAESWLDSISSMENDGDYFLESRYRKTSPQTAPKWWVLISSAEYPKWIQHLRR